MDINIFTIVISAVVVAFAIYWAISHGVKVSDGVGVVLNAAGFAMRFAQDAEQLYETGQLQKNERFDYVFEKLKQQFPGLSESVLTGSIEAAVGWLRVAQGEVMTYSEKIHALIQYFKDQFQLQAWDIYVRVLAHDLMPEEADGYYHAQHNYLVANISVSEGLDDDRLVRVIAHEMAHVLFSPMNSAVGSTISLLPKKLRKRENEAHDHAEEQVAQMLSKGFSQMESIINQLKEPDNGQEEASPTHEEDAPAVYEEGSES